MCWFFAEKEKISPYEIEQLTKKAVVEALDRICKNPKKVLLLPPDITRAYCGAGKIAKQLFDFFSGFADVFLMPTLGQHMAHTSEQNTAMFGDIPQNRILEHDWKNGVKTAGTVPGDYVKKETSGKADWAIPIEIDRILTDEKWDLIINIGHVVPHEVFGFSNHNKNIFIGLGGEKTIASSHIASACCGIENILGNVLSPIRRCFNKAENDLLKLPCFYIMLVMAPDAEGTPVHTGFFCGDNFETYMKAAEYSSKINISEIKPLKKAVAFMSGEEFQSAWTANKAIYRLRKAMADGGELIIIAPGMKRFGEHSQSDEIIRKYGYSGTDKILSLWHKNEDLRENAHVAAHLMHGSSDGRFKITYSPGGLSKDDIETVGFDYLDPEECAVKYPTDKLKNGFNVLPNGENIFFVKNPASGLWISKR